MMSPGDSDFQRRVVNALINYFLNSETTSTAVETTQTCLSVIESEYNVPDDLSTLKNMAIFAISNPRTVWKWHHVTKIRECKQALAHACKNSAENAGKIAVKVLLEFFRKSDNWTVAGYLSGASINMRLTCELLKAAGIKDDCGTFLQKYSVDFMKEVDAATDKFAASIIVASSVELIRSTAFPAMTEPTPRPIILLKESLLEGSHKHFTAVFEEQNLPIQKQQRASSSSPTSFAFLLD